MVRRIGLALAALLVAGTLFAGGQKEAGTKEKVLKMHVLTEKVVNDFMQGVIDAYHSNHPDVTIQLVTDENDAYKTAIQVAVGSNNPPDIFFVWAGEYTGKFVRNKRLLDLTAAYQSPWGKTVTEAAKAPFTLGGKVWAVPYSLETKLVYYNKDLFARAGVSIPKTWDEFVAAGKKLADLGVIPLIMGGMDSWQDCHYISILNQKLMGAAELDKDYYLQRDRAKLFSDPRYVQALEYFKGLKDQGLFPENVATIKFETAQALFYTEKAAMMYGGTWNIAVWDGVNGAAPPEFKNKWAMFTLPAIPGGAGDQNVILGAPIGLAVSAKSPYAKEAVDFLQFFTSLDNQRQFVKVTDRLPAVKGAVTPENADANLQWVAKYVENATGMVGWLDTVLEISISNVYLNDLVAMMNGSKTPEQVMADVREQAEKVQDTMGPIVY